MIDKIEAIVHTTRNNLHNHTNEFMRSRIGYNASTGTHKAFDQLQQFKINSNEIALRSKSKSRPIITEKRIVRSYSKENQKNHDYVFLFKHSKSIRKNLDNNSNIAEQKDIHRKNT